MDKILQSVARQYRMLYMDMARAGVRWNLHRTPGTDQFSLFRADAHFDAPLPIVVRDVHAMTESRLLQRVQDIIRGL